MTMTNVSICKTIRTDLDLSSQGIKCQAILGQFVLRLFGTDAIYLRDLIMISMQVGSSISSANCESFRSQFRSTHWFKLDQMVFAKRSSSLSSISQSVREIKVSSDTEL